MDKAKMTVVEKSVAVKGCVGCETVASRRKGASGMVMVCELNEYGWG